MRPTVVLFDLDGTLVSTGGAGRRAMDAAFRECTGAHEVFAGFQFGGMTDLGIVRAGLERAGRPFEPAMIDAIFEAYLGVLPDEIARSSGYRVLPGIVGALESVALRSGFALGLGTGNVEPGARIKLSRGALDRYFAFGGFGSDAEDRAELLRAGVARGAAALGEPPERCRVVIVGDTPKDVAAALALGAECVTVATGGHGPHELLALGATAAFTDMSSPGALDAILAGPAGV
jgi:phosphoglycolate phosphatase-like HAD superfamily hydrolase